MRAVRQQFLYRAAMHADVFRVHLVPGYFFAFHRFERARPDVERHFLAVDAVASKSANTRSVKWSPAVGAATLPLI